VVLAVSLDLRGGHPASDIEPRVVGRGGVSQSACTTVSKNNVRNTQLRLYLALRMIACAFEEAVKAGDASAMEKLSKEFQSTLSDIEKDNAANEDRRDPLRGLRRSD
jgi:ribosomal protein S20